MNRIKTLCAVFAVVLTGVFVAKGDGMENIPYLAWDEDAQGFVEETCDYAEVVTAETDMLQPGTWYVVTNDVTRGSISVGFGIGENTAHLILCDGVSLTVAGETMQAGLGVPSFAALSIYAQREGTGRLTATGGEMGAGIGGSISSCGAVTINGGIVQATGGAGGAGIGGGSGGASDMITIRGGTITAKGGRNAAGIGGGEGQVGSVTIVGGKISAIGSEGASAIGSATGVAEEMVEISGGVFSIPLDNSWLANGYGSFANTESETKAAYPYAVYQTSTISVGMLNQVMARWTSGDCAVTNVITDSSFKAKLGDTVTVLVAALDENCFLYGGAATYKFVASEETVDLSDKLAKAALYLDVNGVPQMQDNYTLVTDATTTLENGRWYVINSTITRGTISVAGSAHLILCDGATLEVSGEENKAGLRVASGNSITIYGQCKGTGVLTAHGGRLAAGIGGGFHESGGMVTINGGTISSECGAFGAGIGGGAATSDYVYDKDVVGGNGGMVTINGGMVTAIGGDHTAGIGGGYSTVAGGHGGTVIINGGTVEASGGVNAPGIGGGICGDGGTVKITGGRVNSTGRKKNIGSGWKGNDGTIEISGGVFAMTVQEKWLASGCSIITNQDVATRSKYPWMVTICGKITIGALSNMSAVWICEGAEVTNAVTTTSFMAPLDTTVILFFTPQKGYGFQGPETLVVEVAEEIDISNRIPQAVKLPVDYLDEDGVLHTLGADDYMFVTASTATFSDGWYVVVDSNVACGAISVTGAAHLILGDGASLKVQGGISVPSGKSITVYGQRQGTGILTANGGTHCAGIGGGLGGSGGMVTINGGAVTATGDYGAGIGGGLGGSGGMVTINGGTVTAVGGYRSAGIGGGGIGAAANPGAGGELVIRGGRVSVTGNRVPAIGPGANDNGRKGAEGTTSIQGGVFAMQLERSWLAEGVDNFTNPDAETRTAYPWVVLPSCVVTVGEFENLSAVWSFEGSSITEVVATPTFSVVSNKLITLVFMPTDGFWLDGEAVCDLGVVTENLDVTNLVPVARPNELAYVDKLGQERTITGYKVVHETTRVLEDGWYAVLDAEVQPEKLSVSGETKLLLATGMKLSVPGGISVEDRASLAVYGQLNGAGFLEAKGLADAPAIGGEGSVEIIGGTILADEIENSVVIYGGNVAASIPNAKNAAGEELWWVMVENLRTSVPTFADLPPGYGTGGITPLNGKVFLWWPYGTYGFVVDGATYMATVKNAGVIATLAQWKIGAGVTAAWEAGELTISGAGTMDDFSSANDVPWQGLVVTNVRIPAGVKPGRNLLIGLGDTTTVNGAVPVSLIRQFSGDFLVGEVAPAEATALEIDGGQVKLTVEVDASADLKTWQPAKTVEISVPVEGEKGFYLLKTK